MSGGSSPSWAPLGAQQGGHNIARTAGCGITSYKCVCVCVCVCVWCVWCVCVYVCVCVCVCVCVWCVCVCSVCALLMWTHSLVSRLEDVVFPHCSCCRFFLPEFCEYLHLTADSTWQPPPTYFLNVIHKITDGTYIHAVLYIRTCTVCACRCVCTVCVYIICMYILMYSMCRYNICSYACTYEKTCTYCLRGNFHEGFYVSVQYH